MLVPQTAEEVAQIIRQVQHPQLEPAGWDRDE